MTGREKEVEKLLLQNEADALEKLKQTYVEALADVKKEIKYLQRDSDIQSKIYRTDYQKGLEEQINGIMAILNDKQITTVDAFLAEMYEHGYAGIIYAAQGQGIPLVVPISQELLIKSVMRETDGIKLSERLYTHVDVFKSAIVQEISRGIAQNAPYKDIALHVAVRGNTTYKRACTITRTEGGRVATDARLDSITRLRAKGADLVKYWDATLDGKTRPAHARLHGQWVEDGELFETYDDDAGKVTTLAPHGFGIPHLDINCRCALLARPRWAVTGGSHFHIDNITDETIEANSFTEWLTKYHAQDAVLLDKYSSLLRG